jgi:hypothetical protein
MSAMIEKEGATLVEEVNENGTSRINEPMAHFQMSLILNQE